MDALSCRSPRSGRYIRPRYCDLCAKQRNSPPSSGFGKPLFSNKRRRKQERLSARQTNIRPLIDAFFAWIRDRRGYHQAKSLTGEAITYCLNQEKYLRVVLEDGYVPMDNNAAERGIRTFCLGKKHWYTIDTVSGVRASAIHYSIAESARANNLKPYEYFKYLLEELMIHQDDGDLSYLDQLLPWADGLPDICKKPPASTEPGK